ncbi:hypothetical protein [Leptospira noguchii]|uniref:Uncharacterized protein n=1 Tax=Leptospira noguchii TaxID=28182 RepID=A0AAE9GIF8_9LEPT|nr:hypothetical protein [Leptospira noguchii]UOG31798.1 hypothetical protein MAL06_07330 [Leptospira noguchii]UOG57909.1 hypothetical protein MAL03_07270 [Leptospira noguchii]
MKLKLDNSQKSALYKVDPNSRRNGGFQSLLVSLQEKCNPHGNSIELNIHEIERIKRYSQKYRNGGWQNTLKTIFPSIAN